MKIQNLIYFVLFVFGALFISSCGEDLPGTGGEPSVSLSETSFTTMAGETFTTTVTGSKGDAALKTLTVTAGGQTVDPSRITINGSAGQNPNLILGTDVDGFTYIYTITTHDTDETLTYTFTLTDEDGLTDSASATVSNTATPPSIVYNGVSPITVAPNSLFTLNFDLVKGSRDLYALAIYEDGELIPDSRAITYQSPNVAYDPLNINYFTIEEDAQGAENVKLTLRASDVSGSHTYRIVLEAGDANGTTASEFSVEVISGNTVMLREGVLWNRSGPNFGAFDLNDGVAVSSSSTSAEIRDLGIDTNQPVSSNWLKQLEPVNGAEMKYVVPGQSGVSESFSFESVSYVDQLTQLWDSGASTISVTNKLNSGDMLLVRNDGAYYLISIKAVNETSSDNMDNYVFDIKS